MSIDEEFEEVEFHTKTPWIILFKPLRVHRLYDPIQVVKIKKPLPDRYFLAEFNELPTASYVFDCDNTSQNVCLNKVEYELMRWFTNFDGYLHGTRVDGVPFYKRVTQV